MLEAQKNITDKKTYFQNLFEPIYNIGSKIFDINMIEYVYMSEKVKLDNNIKNISNIYDYNKFKSDDNNAFNIYIHHIHLGQHAFLLIEKNGSYYILDTNREYICKIRLSINDGINMDTFIYFYYMIIRSEMVVEYIRSFNEMCEYCIKNGIKFFELWIF